MEEVMNGRLASRLVGTALVSLVAGCAGRAPDPVVGRPTVAFGAQADDLPRMCQLDGEPRVLATHVVPNAGLTAQADDSGVWLRFSTTRRPRVAQAFSPESLAPQADDRPPPVQTAAAPQTDEPGASRIITVDSDGTGVELPIDLGYQGAAIGRPVGAVTPAGRGLVAFVEPGGAGFRLVATRLVCTR
jgi:hypothetical protein